MNAFEIQYPALAWLAAMIPVLFGGASLVLRARSPLRPRYVLPISLLVSAVLVALSGPVSRTRQPQSAVALFAIDISPSVPMAQRRKALEMARSIAKPLGQDGVIVEFILFDGTPRLISHRFPTESDLGSENASHGASRLAPVLMAAEARIPSGAEGRLYLFSDGRFADSDDVDRISMNLEILVYPLRPEGDVQLEVTDVDLDRPLEEGTPTRATVTLRSNVAGTGRVFLKTGTSVVDMPVTVSAGITRVMFPDRLLPRGLNRVSAWFQSADDGLPSSSASHLDARVEGPPKVLFLDCRAPTALGPLKALETQGIELSASTWERIDDLESLEAFDAVMLCSPPDPAGLGEWPDRLTRYVAQGGGVILIAGREGFGPSWAGTPLAAAVPVEPPMPVPPPKTPDPGTEEDLPAPPAPEPDPEPEPDPKPPEPAPPDPKAGAEPPTEKRTVEVASVALVFLIDKSGSMAGRKIRLAKEAAIAAASEIGPENRIGVLAFDTQAYWLVSLTSAGERPWIIDRVSRLQAGGGTNIFPALVKSLNALKEEQARIKHVILISDGYNRTLEDFKGIVARMAKNGISLSTIGVGEHFDTRLLSQLTYWAGSQRGRFDFTRDFGRIPRLVLEQTRWAMGEPDRADETPGPKPKPPPDPPPVPPPDPEPPKPPPDDPAETEPDEQEPVPIRLAIPHPSPPFQGFQVEDVPAVYGVRQTRASVLGDVLATTPEGDPVFVVGEYGLGRVLYLGTDFSGPWGVDWRNWPDLPRWLGQALRWVKRRPEDPVPPKIGFLQGRSGGLDIEVLADPVTPAPESVPKITWLADGDEIELPVLRTGTHRFLSVLTRDRRRSGASVRVEFPPGAGARPLIGQRPVPPIIAFEKAFTTPDMNLLARLARRSGGTVRPPAAVAQRMPATFSEVRRSVSWLALLVALAVFPAFLALRRREWNASGADK